LNQSILLSFSCSNANYETKRSCDLQEVTQLVQPVDNVRIGK